MKVTDLMALHPLFASLLGWLLGGLLAGLAVFALLRLLPRPTRLGFRLRLATLILKTHRRQGSEPRRRNPYFRIVEGGGDG